MYLHKLFRKIFTRLFVPLTGFAALLWFLVRVLPRPSRASYPCMKAAAPLASGFVVWLLSLGSSLFAFRSAKKYMKQARYFAAASFIIVGVIFSVFMTQPADPPVFAKTQLRVNDPVGEGKGVIPGRVVWYWDPDATNENGSNNWNDAYYLSKNSDIDIIERMVTKSILSLTEKSTLKEAWDAMFTNFNKTHERDEHGYQDGEKIMIKINSVGSDVNSSYKITKLHSYRMARTSPQPVLILLRHLVNEVGVAEENIYVGDPMKDIAKPVFDVWHDEFKNVNYMCKRGGNGRRKTRFGRNYQIFYSDRGSVLREGTWNDATQGAKIYQDKFYQCIENADYMINVPALKAHHRAGMTLIAKNHFGSHTRASAKHLHNGLVNPDGQPVTNPKRAGYGLYRVQVDLMGHDKLGNNTMLILVDGLWGGPDANDAPEKFKMSPFNNDWPSSIFVSQDQVAIASVCLDFLQAEFVRTRHQKTYPNMPGADDYLRQAADPNEWPEDVEYDPENDGTLLTGLGVHEHWNNAEDKIYTGSLGGDGIDFVQIHQDTQVMPNSEIVAKFFRIYENYPNPFNPSTTIEFFVPQTAELQISIYNTAGQQIEVLGDTEFATGRHSLNWDATDHVAGTYFYKITAQTESGVQFQDVKKMTYLK